MNRNKFILTIDECRVINHALHENYKTHRLYESNYMKEVFRDELRFQLMFFNELKQGFKGGLLIESIFDLVKSVSSVLSFVKDAMTGSEFVQKHLPKFFDKFVKPVLDKLIPLVLKLVPSSVQKGVKDFGKWIVEQIKPVIEWIKKNVSIDGLAKMCAILKYGLKPTPEQIECMVPAAKLLFSYFLTVLVMAFLIKLTIIISTTSPALLATVTTASFTPLIALLSSAGIAKSALTMFGAYSAYSKHKKIEKLKKEFKSIMDTERNSAESNLKSAWNYCSK